MPDVQTPRPIPRVSAVGNQTISLQHDTPQRLADSCTDVVDSKQRTSRLGQLSVQAKQFLQAPVGKNLFWLTFERGLQIIDGVLVGAWVARYLGPERLGILAYAVSLTALFSPLLMLGLDRVAVRDLVQKPAARGEIFWSVFGMRLVAVTAVLCLFILASFGGLLPADSSTERQVVLIAMLGMLGLPLNSGRLLLEAEVQSKWAVWVNAGWLVVSAMARVTLILYLATLESFAAVQATVTIGTGLVTLLVLRRIDLLPTWRPPSPTQCRKLLHECWPLILSGIAVTLYMNADVAMLRWMKGANDAGIYSVAAQMSAFWYFLPMALQSTYFPSLSNAFQQGPESFRRAYQRYADINAVATYAAIAASLLIFPTIIRLLFGESFEASIGVFRIHIFGLLFVTAGLLTGPLVTLQSRQRIGLAGTSTGAIANLVLNAVLIPQFSSLGAAIATVLSYAIAALVIAKHRVFHDGSRAILKSFSGHFVHLLDFLPAKH